MAMANQRQQSHSAVLAEVDRQFRPGVDQDHTGERDRIESAHWGRIRGPMASLSLAARPRELRGRHVKALRRHGAVPAVVYGHEQESMPIEADLATLERIWQRAGRTHLIDLVIDGGTSRKVLIRELQINPRTGRIAHADFLAVNLLEKLTADIPLVIVGEAPAVSELKIGQLLQTMTTVKVECLPSDLPPQITVDVSGLDEIDKGVTLGEVPLPPGVTLVHADLGETVVKVSPLRVREEEEEVAPAEEIEGAEEAGEGPEGAAAAEESDS
jgi:large subunit ribosomal protein L25